MQAELVYDLINRQFLCGKCPKPVTIQYLLFSGRGEYTYWTKESVSVGL